MTPAATPLVIRFGAMGDMILLTVLLRILHRRYGRPCDVVSSGGWTRGLFAGHPDVGRVILLDSRRRPYWTDPKQWALVRALRERPPGPVYVCDRLLQDKIVWWLHRGGVQDADVTLYRSTDFSHADHWCERWARFGAATPAAWTTVPALDPANVPAHPLMPVSEAARADLAAWRAQRGLNGPILLLQPGSKRTLKRGRLAALGDSKWWPVPRWAGLATHLLETRPDAQIVLCGSPGEQPLLQEIAAAVGSSRVHACGDSLPLARLQALCEVAEGMVSIDTGPAHAAVAAGCPTVVLFGAAHPATWTPRGPAGTAVTALGGLDEGLERVEQIPLARVIDAWQALPLRFASRSPVA